jgi:threonine synthase
MRFQTDRPTSWQVCLSCGNELTETDPHPRCPRCGGLLEIAHRPPDLTAPELLLRFTDRRGRAPGVPASGVWRFREIVLPSAERIVSHPEGNTPLLHREALDRWSGAEGLLLKHEGHNPTGSFKDRGMTVGVTQALRVGARAVACASTGNTSASLAAYAAQAGLPFGEVRTISNPVGPRDRAAWRIGDALDGLSEAFASLAKLTM